MKMKKDLSKIHEREKWLFDPKNKHILDRLKKAIERSKDPENLIDFNELKKQLNWK